MRAEDIEVSLNIADYLQHFFCHTQASKLSKFIMQDNIFPGMWTTEFGFKEILS